MHAAQIKEWVSPMAVRSDLSPTFEISMPSIAIEPSSSSKMRKSSWTRVDFPEPVRPTMPTFSLGAICRFRLISTRSNSGLYRAVTPLNSMAPSAGQPRGGSSNFFFPPSSFSISWSYAASTLMVLYSLTRSTEFICSSSCEKESMNPCRVPDAIMV